MKRSKTSRRGAQALVPAIDIAGKHSKEVPRPRQTDWLTVRQAAALMGRSERSIYSYLQNGQLAGERRGELMMVSRETMTTFVPRAPGRIRTITPLWRQPPERNAQFLTLISVRQRPGQEERLACILEEMRKQHIHRLPGTAARYLVCNQDDSHEVTLVLVWRACSMPPAEERETAFTALRTYLAEVVDWNTAVVKEGRAFLYA